MAIAKKTKNSLVVRAVLTGDRADRRAMAAWRRRVVIMIPSNMIDVLARVLVLAGFALVHRSARGKATLESKSCTDLESWIGIEVRLAVVTSAVTDVARELAFLFSSHARARALSTGQPDARRLAATHEDAELSFTGRLAVTHEDTDALARLPVKERGATAKEFNYVIFAKLDHYLNAKVCALGEAMSLPSTSQARWRAGAPPSSLLPPPSSLLQATRAGQDRQILSSHAPHPSGATTRLRILRGR